MQQYMERTLADCPLAPVPLADPYALRQMVGGEEALWTQVQHACFQGQWQETYEKVYGIGGFAALGLWFAVCDGQAVGIAAGAVRRTEAGTPYGYVDWVGVVPTHRRRGLGAALTVAAVNFLAERGLGHAGLWTQSERVQAIRLYQRLGFVKVAVPEGLGVGEYRQHRADAGYPPLAQTRRDFV